MIVISCRRCGNTELREGTGIYTSCCRRCGAPLNEGQIGAVRGEVNY